MQEKGDQIREPKTWTHGAEEEERHGETRRGWNEAARQAADSWMGKQAWHEEVPSGGWDFGENKCQCYKQPKPVLISPIAFMPAVH